MSEVLTALVPFAVYLVWLISARSRARRAGVEPPHFGEAPWIALAFATLFLIALLLGGVALWERNLDPDEAYQPPRVVNGRIQPGGRADPPAEPPLTPPSRD